MTIANNISYITSPEIDHLKWNMCIDGADNGFIYAKSYYLDIMAPGWDALVLNDYEAVMPLTWKRKYGFHYLFQPYFVPSLGVFGKNIPPSTLLGFLMAVPKKFRYWDINLNEANSFTVGPNNLQINTTGRINHILQLNRSYTQIRAGYKRLCVRMLQKAANHLVYIDTLAQPGDAISFYRKIYNSRHKAITLGIYERLITAATICKDRGEARIYLAKLPGGEITAAYLLLVDNKFVYSLIGGSSETGKQTGSFYLLTDAAIKDYAGTNRKFRFEGSDLPGIALFDSQFGPETISYQHITRNKLPFPVNLLKGGSTADK